MVSTKFRRRGDGNKAFVRFAMLASLGLAVTSCATRGTDGDGGADPVILPFSNERDQVVIEGTLNGRPARFLLDTGVDPSAVDLATAHEAGLPLSRQPVGEAEGEGEGRTELRETVIQGLRLGGSIIGPAQAAAMDMTSLQSADGPRLDGVLGYSFLRDRIVLIDYPANIVAILSNRRQSGAWTSRCALRHSIPLISFEGDTIPVIREFRIGAHAVPASIDTGSSLSLGLFQGALRLPGVADHFAESAAATVTGARGQATRRAGVLNLPVGFGPFSLPPGQPAQLRSGQGSPETRLVNLGNRFFRAAGLKMLLDYPAGTIDFFGDCPSS